ncbi:MAG TPA: hypothetical protein VGG38_16095 [Acidimicrobiales bacterium]|jgi:hypothetical protein
MAKKQGGGDKSDKADKATKAANADPHWGNEPAEHDFPAAADYLSLLGTASEVRRLVTALKVGPVEHRKAKDLLRASRLALLPKDNPHVVSDLAKVAGGTKLSPVLLVRGDLQHDVALTIADGYHRVCASWYLDENADIPCHLVDLRPSGARTASRTRSRSAPAAPA